MADPMWQRVRKIVRRVNVAELLLGLLAFRYGALILSQTSERALFTPFLFRSIDTALPPLNATHWGIGLAFLGLWTMYGSLCALREREKCFRLRKWAMFVGFIVWMAVMHALRRAKEPMDAWLTYPILAMCSLLMFYRFWADERQSSKGGGG